MSDHIEHDRCVTVAELIGLLRQCPQDAPVLVEGAGDLSECSGVNIYGTEVVLAKHGGPFVESKAECGLA